MNAHPVAIKLDAIENELKSYFLERDEFVHGLLSALVSRSNVLTLGPPGTGKSYLVESAVSHIKNGEVFSWLLHRYSTPEEIFGNYSLRGLEEDRYRRATSNKLPEADVAFLDEIFKSNAGLLNSLLSVLNERIFYDDGSKKPLPLKMVVGASNEVPDPEDGLEALYDRFHYKYVVDYLQETSNFIKLLKENDVYEAKTFITMEELEEAYNEIDKVEIVEGILKTLSDIRSRCLKEGFEVTDRTYKFMKKALKVEAWRCGSSMVTDEHLVILSDMIWQQPKDARKASSLILELVNPEKNKIQALFESGQTLSNNIFQMNENDAERLEKALEAMSKIKTAKLEIEKLIKTMESKRRNTDSSKSMLNQLDAFITRIATEVCGISF